MSEPNMYLAGDDVPRYRKKSTKRGASKSSHKHVYENCVFKYRPLKFTEAHGMVKDMDSVIQSIGLYCPICGKIKTVSDDKWMLSERGFLGISVRWNDKALDEFDEKKRTLPCFWLADTFFQKYVKETDTCK